MVSASLYPPPSSLWLCGSLSCAQAGGGDDSSSEEGRDDALVDMDSEERDDYTLRDSDLLLVAARHEDDVSTLEVWVYEEAGTSTGVDGVGWGAVGM